MEDVLELHAEPYGPRRPTVGFDEASKELRDHVTEPVPPGPGRPAKEDYEYARHGTANLFVVVGPLAGRRHLSVTERRAAPDLAFQTKQPCDELCPDAEVTRVVLDNLNTHALGPLFATFGPDEAWRLARKLGFHHAPKHASWLNVAGCERSVLSRQCLSRRTPGREELAREVAAWQAERNQAGVKTHWPFRVADARRKLSHLYPQEPLR